MRPASIDRWRRMSTIFGTCSIRTGQCSMQCMQFVQSQTELTPTASLMRLFSLSGTAGAAASGPAVLAVFAAA